jgi:carbamoyl-phosphate synthase large subunit
MKALVTGAGAVLGQGIIKSLRQSTLPCEIVAADPNPLSAGLYWGESAYQLPFAIDPAFGDRITEIVDRERPDVILVGTDVELTYFADKFETYQFFADRGFNPPQSARGEDAVAVAALIDTVGFPLVVKPRNGARSVGVSVVNDRCELERALDGRSGLVIQECVGDDECEYTASVLVFDGEAQASITMRRDLRDGNTYRAYTGEYEPLNRAVCAFGEALRPHGPANFQFRIGRDGTPRVFEINARFSGTTPMRAMVGFNEVEMCIRKLLFGEAISQPVVRSGVILRFLDELFVPHERIARVS